MAYPNACLATNMQSFDSFLFENPSAQITVRHIFQDNDNWARYCFYHGDELREIEVKEVEKMLRCHQDGKGFFVYHCSHCKESWVVSNGCNSRICSECGKRYTDKWAKRLSTKMFEVPHRHLVLSVPDIVWYILRGNKIALKTFMDASIKAINETFKSISHSTIKKGGAIVVLHPYGKDMEFKAHLHVFMTEGGFNKYKKFVHMKFIAYEVMRKMWQYYVLTELRKVLPKTQKYNILINACFTKYGNGFYVHMPEESRITSKKDVANYVGRYVRHPAIANTRISHYDGTSVIFWYYKDKNKKVKIFVEVTVEEFIRRIIQHIPEPQFKMIRYYGAYCRKWKRKYQHYQIQESLTHSIIAKIPRKREYFCPNCGMKLKFDHKLDNPPPRKRIFGEFIEDWGKLSWGRNSLN
jgi:hypothetical protein